MAQLDEPIRGVGGLVQLKANMVSPAVVEEVQTCQFF